MPSVENSDFAEWLLGFLSSRLQPSEMDRVREKLTASRTAKDDLDEPMRLPGELAGDGCHAFAFDSADAGRIAADREMAIAATEPYVGAHVVRGQPSAARVFRAALASLGVAADSVHASGLPEMFRMRRGAPPRTDSAASAAFLKRHPEMARIKIYSGY